MRGGDRVCYTRNLEIEGSDGEVGGLGMGRDEGAEGGGGGVVLPSLVFSDARYVGGTERSEVTVEGLSNRLLRIGFRRTMRWLSSACCRTERNRGSTFAIYARDAVGSETERTTLASN